MNGEWQQAFISKKGDGKRKVVKATSGTSKPCPHGKYVSLKECRKAHTKYSHDVRGLMGVTGERTQPTRITNVVSGGAPGTGKRKGR